MALYGIDWETGEIVWKYHAPSVPFETPYSGYTSLRSAAIIADGKVYVCNDEHSPTNPLTRGWKLHCVNATTGAGIWNISGAMRPGPIADGYLAGGSMYDGYLYWFGKGESATTVEGPKTAITLGQSVVLTGTVLDESPAQSNTPCVSKESMTTQMEYLHMQVPIDGIWHNLTITGVPVALTAIDENGGSINIGTATTSAYYGTYEIAWTPPAEGTYKIIASFAGDESYGSSGAQTAVLVGPTEQQVVIPAQVMPPDYTMTIVGMGLAILAAVIIVGVLVLRKR